MWLPAAPANFGYEVGNTPPRSSLLGVGSIPENNSSTPSADIVPSHPGEDGFATAQVESSLANSHSNDEGEDGNDNDVFDFGDDLDGEVVYYPFAAPHDVDDSEDEAAEDEAKDNHDDGGDDDYEGNDNGDEMLLVANFRWFVGQRLGTLHSTCYLLSLICSRPSPRGRGTDYHDSDEDESVVEGEKGLWGSMSLCTNTMYVYVPFLAHIPHSPPHYLAMMPLLPIMCV